MSDTPAAGLPDINTWTPGVHTLSPFGMPPGGTMKTSAPDPVQLAAFWHRRILGARDGRGGGEPWRRHRRARAL